MNLVRVHIIYLKMTLLVLLAFINSTDGNSSLGRGSRGSAGFPVQFMSGKPEQGFEGGLTVGRGYRIALVGFAGTRCSIKHMSARGDKSWSRDCGNSHLKEKRITNNNDIHAGSIFISLAEDESFHKTHSLIINNFSFSPLSNSSATLQPFKQKQQLY